MAADCKSAALSATEVRILPCAPFIFMRLFHAVAFGGNVLAVFQAVNGDE